MIRLRSPLSRDSFFSGPASVTYEVEAHGAASTITVGGDCDTANGRDRRFDPRSPP